jgi:hypothetical protein
LVPAESGFEASPRASDHAVFLPFSMQGSADALADHARRTE